MKKLVTGVIILATMSSAHAASAVYTRQPLNAVGAVARCVVAVTPVINPISFDTCTPRLPRVRLMPTR